MTGDRNGCGCFELIEHRNKESRYGMVVRRSLRSSLDDLGGDE
jgi:hypothetical protein